MGLERYRQKRDFRVSPEPKGKRRQRKGFSYVIQKHAASQLHYDFRLELDGVLLSWAVPKGPSLDPEVRRLAMQTEDHPVEYGSFEGTIPKGEYGGGTVMVWDQGTWSPLDDPNEGYAKGHLRFELHGSKLRGGWHLVRTGKKTEVKKTWLLFKSRDSEAKIGDHLLDERPNSAQTGRSMTQIAESQGRVWHSNRASANGAAPPRLTHPDRVLYPREKITKQELADYYVAVSQWMLPHVANRPLTLVRCPEGIEGQRFFQKHAKPRLPDGVRRVLIDEDGTPAAYMAVADLTGILQLVQMSVLEIHTWGTRADDPEKPNFLVFDLDPDPSAKWEAVIDCAKLLRRALHELGLESYVKTTGGKGLHVCTPIARRLSWDEAMEFTRGISQVLVQVKPELHTATMSKARRRGKIFIDFFRNGRGASFIAPYSTRARAGAPVAVPLAWDELSPKLRADHFRLREVVKRLSKLKEDPWKDASSKRQILSAAALRSVVGRGGK
jgi:bifunctional non-homologous end joining protein LigD